MPVSQERLSQLAMLSQATNPALDSGTTYAEGATLPGPPDSTLVSPPGVSTQGALVTMVEVQCRANPAMRQADVTVTAVVGGETYTITVGGVGYNYVAGGGDAAEDIIDGLDAAVLVSPLIGSTVQSVDGLTLTIQGADATDYTVAVSATGAASLGLDADATAVTFEVLVRLTGRSAYRLPPDGTGLSADRRNAIQPVNCGSLDRIFVRPLTADGRVVVFVNPCILEAGSA